MAQGVYLPQQVPNFGNGQLNPFGLNVTIGPSPNNNSQGGVVIDFTSYITPTTDPLTLILLRGYGSPTNITINNVTLINSVISSVDCDYVTITLNNVSFSGLGSSYLTPILIAPRGYTSTLTINGGSMANAIGYGTVPLISVSQCDLLISGVEYYNNSGYTMISVSNATFTMDNSLVYSNAFTNMLIGLSATHPGSSLTKTTITNNNMSAGPIPMGSVIEVYQGSLSLVNSWLDSNYGMFNLINMRVSKVSMQGTKLTNNSISASAMIYGIQSTFDMASSSVTNNLYYDSLAIWFYGSDMTLTDVVFGKSVTQGPQASSFNSIILCQQGNITFNDVTNNNSGHNLMDCSSSDPPKCTIHGDQDVCDAKSGPSGGAIAGIVIGCILGAILIIVIIILAIRYAKRHGHYHRIH
ncbi:hypothetical protein SAMD00019534_094660 [Acytostelium subglobosum LB1]|uniref:hypothetical protein n=1 Tax=Acytostelium subglobosum LB1 TaxID=1410327 RepID=UPI0006447D68|nr:hypothetical protein SAMD00019534_094660 [Acytostelium subglobosum LB1]GAM26291.1 hypothetical protein SAMD00019534_094660 [Acytostelium subglobosum LB1]|eukprot:XP_012750845.1 hypothetical protein SAMD00019534_094660 [Acytostelium subglobosum LB1]